MKISEVDKAMGVEYRRLKAANGGYKTAPKGKYGFKSIQFKVVDTDGVVYGPFLGRGSALSAFKNEIKAKGKPVEGVKFLVEDIFRPKDKSEPKVDGTTVFEVK
jgi:hypothetical protein